jgi:HD domain-containing protein
MFAPDRYVAALRFAAERHRGQTLPGSDLPYVVHITSVAAEVIAVLPESNLDADLAVVCALLHDTVEDTQTTADEVAAAFGTAVRDGVAALSKNPALPKSDAMADSLARIRTQPLAVWAVKLADRITNLAPPPPHWTPPKCATYRAEAQTILDALGGTPARAYRHVLPLLLAVRRVAVDQLAVLRDVVERRRVGLGVAALRAHPRLEAARVVLLRRGRRALRVAHVAQHLDHVGVESNLDRPGQVDRVDDPQLPTLALRTPLRLLHA